MKKQVRNTILCLALLGIIAIWMLIETVVYYCA
jgi:hypothetical protein